LKNHNLYLWKDASVISIAGTDAETFLQGYITSDVIGSTPSTLLPMSITDIKGRVLCSGWTTKHENGIDLIVHRSLKQSIELFLKPYIQFSKSKLMETHKVVCHSDKGLSLWNTIFLELQEANADLEYNNQKDEELWTLLTLNKFAFIQECVSGKFLPQHLGLHLANAVDFDKGCYLGQEIVARAEFRGSVKKKLLQVNLSSGEYATGNRLMDGSILVQISASGLGLAVGKTEQT